MTDLIQLGTDCPLCGHKLNQLKIAVDLNTNTIRLKDKMVRVTPQQAELLFVLARASPGVVSVASLMYQLEGFGSYDLGVTSLRTQISRIRNYISDLGLLIVSHRNRGYALRVR